MNRTKEVNRKREGYNKRKGVKGNKKSYNGKSNSRSKSTQRGDERDAEHALSPNETPNNPKWYFISDEVKDQVCRLSFQDILGVSTPLNEEMPNLLRVFMNPSPGVASPSAGVQSGFNQSMFMFYTQLSAFTGRTQSYGPQDIGIIILALGEILSTAEYIRRFFGISAISNERNYSYPKYIIQHLGIDPDDFSQHRADYRDRFNYLLTRINALPIPATVAYLQKCVEIYQNVFLDDPNSLATSFAYIPATSWYLVDNEYEGGAYLKTVDMALGYEAGTSQSAFIQRDLGFYLNRLESMVTRLQTSAVWSVVYSDILNYVSKASLPLFKLDFLSDNYAVVPSYNIEAVLQLKHMVIMTSANMYTTRPTEVTTMNITPYNDVYPDMNNNGVDYNPAFHPAVDVFRHDLMLSLPITNPGPDVLLEATRFMASYGSLVNNMVINNSLPDHWAVFLEIKGNANNTIEGLSSNTLTFEEVTAAHVRALSKISCAPFLYLHSSGVPAGVIGDVQYFTQVPETWVDKLIKNVTLGLYTVR